jgi:hypothetical protein
MKCEYKYRLCAVTCIDNLVYGLSCFFVIFLVVEFVEVIKELHRHICKTYFISYYFCYIFLPDVFLVCCVICPSRPQWIRMGIKVELSLPQ